MKNPVKKNMDRFHRPKTHGNKKAGGRVREKDSVTRCRSCRDAIDPGMGTGPGCPDDVCGWCWDSVRGVVVS